MRRLFLLGSLLLVGCGNVVGPFARREPERVDDPRFSIPEQERRGRFRLAYPEAPPSVAPHNDGEIPGPGSR